MRQGPGGKKMRTIWDLMDIRDKNDDILKELKEQMRDELKELISAAEKTK